MNFSHQGVRQLSKLFVLDLVANVWEVLRFSQSIRLPLAFSEVRLESGCGTSTVWHHFYMASVFSIVTEWQLVPGCSQHTLSIFHSQWTGPASLGRASGAD